MNLNLLLCCLEIPKLNKDDDNSEDSEVNKINDSIQRINVKESDLSLKV